MFHVELRQFPHTARAFNLTRDEVDARIVRPWVAGVPVSLNDRSWTPERAKLSIYEGPALETEEMGLGRGWANATRTGEDVTDRLVAQARGAAPARPSLEDFKAELVNCCARGQVSIAEILELASDRYPRSRVSELIALAEQTVWELLHTGKVELLRDGAPLGAEAWQDALLSLATWRDAGAAQVFVRAVTRD